MAKDLMCGMAVDESSPFHAERDGQRFYFCSEHCRKEFIGQTQHLDSAAGTLVGPHSEHDHIPEHGAKEYPQIHDKSNAGSSSRAQHDHAHYDHAHRDQAAVKVKPSAAVKYFCPMCAGGGRISRGIVQNAAWHWSAIRRGSRPRLARLFTPAPCTRRCGWIIPEIAPSAACRWNRRRQRRARAFLEHGRELAFVLHCLCERPSGPQLGDRRIRTHRVRQRRRAMMKLRLPSATSRLCSPSGAGCKRRHARLAPARFAADSRGLFMAVPARLQLGFGGDPVSEGVTARAVAATSVVDLIGPATDLIIRGNNLRRSSRVRRAGHGPRLLRRHVFARHFCSPCSEMLLEFHVRPNRSAPRIYRCKSPAASG